MRCRSGDRETRQALSHAGAVRTTPRREEVADAIREYLSGVEDRAHKAELEAAKARVREEGERRAKRLTLGLAAAVLLGVLGGGAGFWRADQAERERTARAAQTVGTALEEVSLALGRAREAGSSRLAIWPEAVGAAERAVSLAEKVDAPADVLDRAVAIRDAALKDQAEAQAVAEQQANEQEMVARLQSIRDYRWNSIDRPDDPAVTAGRVRDDLAARASRFAEAFQSGGIDWAFPRKAAARVAASEHREQLILALDAWRQFLCLGERNAATVEGYLRLADPDELRTRIRTGADGRTPCARS